MGALARWFRFGDRRVLASLVLVAGMVLGVGTEPAGAASVIYVDQSAVGAADGTSWSDAFTDLQDGLAAATAGDEILVAEGIYTPDPNDIAVSFGLPDGVVVTGGYEAGGVSGPDPDLYPVVLDGDLDADPTTANSRHVVIADLASSATLQNVTIRNGEADGFVGSTDADEQGGGIRHAGGDLTLMSVNVVGNWAFNEGGGIYTEAGVLTILDSMIEANRSEEAGGGVANFGSIVVVADTTISSNSTGFLSRRDGAGIFQEDGSLSVTDSFITLNNTEPSQGEGGGVYVEFGTSSFIRTSITNNTARSFGGAYLGGSGSTIESSSIDDNEDLSTAFSFVGGVGGAFIDITNSSVSGNTGAGVSGAGLTIRNSTINANTDTGIALAGSGAAASVIVDATITNNQLAFSGSGVIVGFDAEATITNSFIMGNFGDAVRLRENAEVEILDSTIADGSVRLSDPGATLSVQRSAVSNAILGLVAIDPSADVEVIDSDFTDAPIWLGGVGSVFTMTGSSVSEANSGRPGVWLDTGVVATITGSSIIDNDGPSTFTGIGGGLRVDGSATVVDTIISGNTGYASAGVHVADEGVLDLINSTVAANTAQNTGGGIGIVEGGTLTVTNALVLDNTAFTGAGVHSSRGVVDMFNTTISGNTPHPTLGTAGIYHGAFNAPLAVFTVRNSIVHGNGPGFAQVTGANGLFIDYSNIEGGFAGTGNIDVDPLFVAADDFRVDVASPVIDAGDPAVDGGVPADSFDVDGDGDVAEPTPDLDLADRVQGAVDMGAYEQQGAALCNGLPVTVDIGAGGTPTAGDDVILGTPGNDIILAGDGNDTVCAGAGDDSVIGGDGDDWIDGSTGNDELSGNAGADTIMGGVGDDTVFGGSGTDDITGDAGDDTLGAGSGSDTIAGGDGNDRISGGSDADVSVTGGLDDDAVNGGGGDDSFVSGGPGNDSVSGNGGKDKVYGGDGNDTVRGGQADDEVYGEAGDDFVSGNDGFDLCDGGAGVDDTANANNCETILNIP